MVHQPVSAIPFTGGITREGRRVRIYTLGGRSGPTLGVGARVATLGEPGLRGHPFDPAPIDGAKGSVTFPRDVFGGLASMLARRRVVEATCHGFERRRIAERQSRVFHCEPGGAWRMTDYAQETGAQRELAPAVPHEVPERWRHVADVVRSGERGFASALLTVGAMYEGPDDVRITMTRRSVRIAIGTHAMDLDLRDAEALEVVLTLEAQRRVHSKALGAAQCAPAADR